MHVVVDLQEQLALVVRMVDPVVGPHGERPGVEDAEQAVRVPAGQRELEVVVELDNRSASKMLLP